MTHYVGSCGVRWGGNGWWSTAPAPRCQLLVVIDGLLEQMASLVSLMTGNYKVGLYSNDHEPALGDTIAAYVAAGFSGYDGERLTYGWTVPEMRGTRAYTQSSEEVWTYDGGPVTGLVYGYYVINNAGILRFAERFCDGPFPMSVAGRVFKLTLTYTMQNEREVS